MGIVRVFNSLKEYPLEEVFRDVPVYDVSKLAHTGAFVTGNQEKWVFRDEGLILKVPYFEERYWKDYVVEQLAYEIGQQIGFNVAEQFVCRIVDGTREILGTASRFGLKQDEDYSTFYRMVGNYPGIKSAMRGSPAEVFWNIRDIYADCCGFNALRYLFEILCLDLLLGNVDRHLNNFGIGYNHGTGEYFVPKIFDAGLGMFEGVQSIGYQDVDSLIGLLNMKPYGTVTPRDVVQSILPTLPKKIWYEYNWVINLEGMVFPSEAAVRYFMWIAGAMGLRIRGIPIVVTGQQELPSTTTGIPRGSHSIPLDCTLMYKDIPLLKIQQNERDLYPTLIADATKYDHFPVEFRIQERSLNINFVTLKTFFRFRGIPDLRQNKNRVYEAWGASSFDDLGEKSRYLCVDDHYWIKYNYDEIDYGDIKIRD